MRKAILWVLLAMLAIIAPVFAQERPAVTDLLAEDAGGRFTTLLAAIEAAGLTDTVAELEDATILAPTNDAFDALFAYLGVDAADVLADTELLTDVLTYHVIPGTYFFRELTSGPTLATVQGDDVTFNLEGGVFTAAGQVITDVDNLADNGVIVHVAEGVLLPPAVAEAAAQNRAHIRIAHLSPDAGAVDVYINGITHHLEGVTFGTVSDWIEVPAGVQNVALASAGDEPSGGTIRRVEPGSWTTIAAIGVAGSDDLETAFLTEDYSPIADSQARLSFFHAIQNAPAVDILINGDPLVVNLAYPGTLGDNDGFDIRNVPSSVSYDLTVTPYGDNETVLLSSEGFAPATGTNYFIAAAGTPTNPQVIVVGTNLAEMMAPAEGQ
jgi:uncharacterized surface protein with fasciclin (FAS1) repeats